MNPKVSVLMPVYQGEKYLREAIESILAQTFTDFEFIIVEDGSTDRSAGIVQSYSDPRINLIRNDSNLGLIASLNKGLDTVSGEYIARMDQDDISLPERLAKQLAFMEEHPDIAASGTWARDINDKGQIIAVRQVPIGRQMEIDFWRPSPLIHPATIIRAAHLGNMRYDAKALHDEDFDLWLRLRKKYKLDNLPEYLLLYRVHDESISRRNPNSQLRSAYEALCRHTELTMPYEVFLEWIGGEANPIRHSVLTRRMAKALQRAHRDYMADDITYAREWLADRLKLEIVKTKVMEVLYSLWRRLKLRGTDDSLKADSSKPLTLNTKSGLPVERGRP
jgi:glycosyltransferase involved in cell wall biosynthesis